MSKIAIALAIFLGVFPVTADRLAVGNSHACVIRADGTVRCFGAENSMGKLGNGTTKDVWGAVKVLNISDATQLVAGNGRTCALHASGSVSCWGDTRADVLVPPPTAADTCYEDAAARRRKMGLPCTPTPKPVSGVSDVKLIGGNSLFSTLILQKNGELFCLNHGGYKNDPLFVSPPLVRMGNFPNVVEIVTMRNQMSCPLNACLRTDRNEVRCMGMAGVWGNDSDGQATSSAGNDAADFQRIVANGITAIAPPPVENGMFAISADGEVSYIGILNIFKPVRVPKSLNQPQSPQSSRIAIPELSGAVKIASGALGGCAIMNNGQVKCWGDRSHFTLGDGTTKGPGTTPVLVKGISDAVEVGVSDVHACVLTKSDKVFCWGNNGRGHLGAPQKVKNSPVPIEVKLD